MRSFDKTAAVLAFLCRIFGTTPESIKEIKNKSKAPKVTDAVAAARVKGQIIS